ncbi:MAG: hypothetical protein NVSMB47_02420 [Polyangiales bacterium]
MQRDVRLQAALALVVGIALVAVPLFIWGRGRTRSAPTATPASTSELESAGPPTVSFGDAGASISVDAGGRSVTFGEPHYLKCQDPGPSKTSPEKCDHLGAIEELVTRAIVEHAAACVPALTQSQVVATVVDVSFKRRKIRVKAGKDGSTMPAAQRTKVMSCIEKALAAPAFDQLPHAHQRYVFQFPTTFAASVAPTVNIPPPPAPTYPP